MGVIKYIRVKNASLQMAKTGRKTRFSCSPTQLRLLSAVSFFGQERVPYRPPAGADRATIDGSLTDDKNIDLPNSRVFDKILPDKTLRRYT